MPRKKRNISLVASGPRGSVQEPAGAAGVGRLTRFRSCELPHIDIHRRNVGLRLYVFLVRTLARPGGDHDTDGPPMWTVARSSARDRIVRAHRACECARMEPPA